MKEQLQLLKINKTYNKFMLSLLVVLCANFGFAQVNYYESFEGGSVPPASWTTSGASNFLVAATNGTNPAQSPAVGSYQLMWQSYNAQAGTTASLATPAIDWSYKGGNTPTISFWMYRDVTAYNSTEYDAEGVNVYVSTTQSSGDGELLGFVPRRGGASATGAYLTSGVPTTAISGWYQYTFDVPSNYSGSVNYLVFDFYSQYGNNTFLDDISYVAYPNPISFYANPAETCTNTPITTVCTSTSPDAYYYYWIWGDGTYTLETSINSSTHSYSNMGSFNVYLEVFDISWNIIGANNANVYINGGTNGNINLSKTQICPGEQIYMDPAGNNTPLKWMVNGVTIGTPGSYSVNHTFPSLGTYTVSAVFGTPCGNDTISRTVEVINTIYPEAGFSFNPNPSVCPNVNVQVSPYEYAGAHFWDFGDGYTSSSSSPYHPYSSLGIKSITHSITNSCGNTSTLSQTVNVDNTSVPSNANFSYNPSTPLCPGIQVYFNSQNYEGQWNWDFGDGVTATGQNPRHTYTTVGNYTVTQTITNACNNTLSFNQVLAITDTITPNASFSVGPNPACPNDIIGFNPNEQNGRNYFWDFGDGSNSSLKYPSHQYLAAGSYTVSLTVTNSCNRTSTSTYVLVINGSLPINLNAYLNVSPQPACPTQPLNFYVSAYGYPSYNWNYGDGVTETTSNQSNTHAYATAGTYTASVTISNNCGRDTTLYTTVNINASNPFPISTLNASSTSACPGENVSASAPYGFPNYVWNMGDGSPLISSSNYYISYAYSSVGDKIISVNVTDYCGNDTTYQDTVHIINRTTFCAAACSLNVYVNTPACPNQNVNFGATSGYAWYKFKFGDGDSTVSSSSQTSHSFSGIGTYNYTVTITNFCGTDTTVYGSVEINNSQQINNWTNVYAYPDIVCPNQAVQFNTDNNYNTYVWNFGDGYIANGTGSVAHTYTVAGTYNTSVTITNACGNSASFSTTITVDNAASFPNWMSLWTDSDPSCPGSPVTLRTTEGYVSYAWNFGDGNTITTSTGVMPHVYAASGSYQASVTITNSCGLITTVYKTIVINNSVNISYFDLAVPNNPACVNDIVMLNVNAGAGGAGAGNSITGMTFVWDYGDGSDLDTTIGTGSSHVYASTGVYNVSVTATNTCGNSRTTSKIVTINSGAMPQLTQNNFGILVDNMNGNGPVSVCPGDVLVFFFEGINSNNTWDFGDGSTATAIDVITGDNGNSYTIIRHAYTTSGTYNYSLTLGNNCGNTVTQIKQVIVTSGMLISGGLEIEAPSSALGYTTCGLINFISFGGNNFVWDFGDGTTLSTASPMGSHSYTNAGNYTVKVTVTNGCGNSATYIKTLVVNGVGGTVVSASSTIPPTCNNGVDGSAAVNVSGGSAPYTYNWTNAIGQSLSTTDNASGLAAGTYSVIVTDVSGCEGFATITLTNPTNISMTVGVTTSSCGGATGTASVSAITGGTAPYTYSWSNGQTSSTATGLALGTYTITIQDNKGCSSTANASISESGATITVASTTTVSCNGGANGAITTNVSGGTPPYTYLWSNGATTQNISGVAAGSYSVVVTDNGNCNSTINATIAQPEVLNVNAVPVVSPTCGNFDGSATANVSGGTAPYTYLWSSGGVTQTKTGLPKGTYTVTVTDAHGCSSQGIVTLSNLNAPTVVSAVNNISCNGQTNGSINLTVTGGTSPYLYNWSTGESTEDVSGLPVGMYIVTIQDAAGCFSMRNYSITQPNVLTATASSTGTTCGSNNGTATATPVGGNTSFTYSWTGGQTTQTATNLGLGGYTVTVTDNKGCTATANTTIASTVPTIEICLVTVDSLSTHNIIMWDKTSVTGVDSFRIYREDITNVYTHIGTVAYDSLSEYHDMDPTANPNATTKRYKIAAKDACGLESAKSKYHNTLYIISVGSGQFTWNPIYTIENSANPVNNYLLMRDDVSNGTWAQIQSTAGTQNTITDPSFAGFPNASYRVEAAWNITCEATRGAINTTRSNIKSPSSIGIRENLLAEIVSIAPNPAHASVSINLGNTKNSKINLHNSLGQLVYEQVEGGNKHIINVAEFMTGVYFVTIENELGKTIKKLIIE